MDSVVYVERGRGGERVRARDAALKVAELSAASGNSSCAAKVMPRPFDASSAQPYRLFGKYDTCCSPPRMRALILTLS